VKRNEAGEIREMKCRSNLAGKMGKKGTSLLCLLIVLAAMTGFVSAAEDNLAPPQHSGSESLNQTGRAEGQKTVAAKVNGVAITMESVMRMMHRMSTPKGNSFSPPEDMNALKEKALNRLILQELAYQQAKAEGLLPGPRDVGDAMARMKSNAGGEEGFNKFLEKEGLTEEELRVQVGRNLALERILVREVKNKSTVAESEVKKEYDSGKDAFVIPEKIVIADVVFFLDTHSEDSLRKAEEVRKKIEDDNDKDPSKLPPDGTFIVRDLEVKEGEDRELYEAAKRLKPGGLSGVVVASDSIHIIKLKEFSPGKQLTFEDVKDFLEQKLRQKAEQKRMQEWQAELKKDSKIEIIKAREGGR
jgi:foldase protein PrsA